MLTLGATGLFFPLTRKIAAKAALPAVVVVVVFVEPINDAVQFLKRSVPHGNEVPGSRDQRPVSGCLKLPSFHLLGLYSPIYLDNGPLEPGYAML